MKRLAILSLALVTGGLSLAGLVTLDTPIPAIGEIGAPHRPLTPVEEQRFVRGRQLFDKDFHMADGVGPAFNGDSCRACHRDPVIAGSGGIDLQVQRPAVPDGEGGFTSPPGMVSALARTHSAPGTPREEIPENVVFVEERNSPTLLGLGLVELVSAATIRANADPMDSDGDKILGIAQELPGGRVGRIGWKAQFPDLRGFLRDALSNEMGITVPFDVNSPAGNLDDADEIADPEISPTDLEDLLFFMQLLDFPPKGPSNAETQQGETLFGQVGCAKCHIPVLDGVELYSDLLLHDVLGDGFQGVTQELATSGLYRTPPLRGLRDTAPYFHDGRAPTIEAAIARHAEEAADVLAAFEALTDLEKAAVIAFLRSL
jgi:CxxC motif-containing protein (DUF1111 family)